MRYARVAMSGGPRYVAVERRDDEDWLTRLLPDFPESCAGATSAHEAAWTPRPLAGATLLAPVEPGKIVCVGRNYREHARELGNEAPAEPLLFFKPPSSLLEPEGVIIHPALSERVDFEGELGIVIGRRVRGFEADDDPRSVIRGYTAVNDVTARDLQKRDGQWTRAKGFDTFCPVGPIVTDEIDPVGGTISLETRLNGAVKQQGETGQFLFGIAALLAYVTSFLTLEAGDLIPTGTPAGVGPMQPGDVVEVRIAGIGTLRNRVAR